MKISKLFHWLYATLMFLPFIFLLPTLAYYGFNEHAINTEFTNITYKYQSNEVNSVDDLVVGNIYSFNCNNLALNDLLGEDESVDFLLLTDLSFNEDLEPAGTNGLQNLSSNTYLRLYVLDDSEMYVITYSDSSFLARYHITTFEYYDVFSSDCIIQLLGGYYFNSPSLIQYLSYTDFNVIESAEVNNDNTITSSVARSWNSVWNLPLFSWTHNSFVAEPFTYITGLFGMSADNPFNYVVTYFVSISVCWLVFDFLMYVPNLAHRWLDKGALD